MRKMFIFGAFLCLMSLVLLSMPAVPTQAQNPSPCYTPSPVPGTGSEISLTKSTRYSYLGINVTFTANVAGGTWGADAGSIVFMDGFTQIGKVLIPGVDSIAPVSFTTNKMTVGDHTIGAFYSNACGISNIIYGDWISHTVLGRLQ
jgi:hypothetical protein